MNADSIAPMYGRFSSCVDACSAPLMLTHRAFARNFSAKAIFAFVVSTIPFGLCERSKPPSYTEHISFVPLYRRALAMQRADLAQRCESRIRNKPQLHSARSASDLMCVATDERESLSILNKQGLILYLTLIQLYTPARLSLYNNCCTAAIQSASPC